MLKQTVTDKGLIFSVNSSGHELPFEKWTETDDCIYYFPLSSLVDNGFAEIEGTACVVPFENLYLLDEEEMMLLGVPAPFTGAMRLRAEGILNYPDFKYKLDFLNHRGEGDILKVETRGNIASIDGKECLLTLPQYDLLEAVNNFNSSIEERTAEDNLLAFARIKKLTEEADCELDSYLANENVYVPEKIKIEVNRDEEGVTIEPGIDIPENEKFQHTFDRSRQVRSSYPVARENGERIRVILNKEQKADLEGLKRTGTRHKSMEEVRKIVANPTEYFDPDNFDLSELYSDRVIEIGLYRPKFSAFISPYKSSWVAGATVETPYNGSTKITIDNEELLEQLQGAIHQAEKEKKEFVNYANTEIALDDAKFLADTASKQLASPDKVIEVNDNNARKVLIIEENEEALAFSEAKSLEQTNKYTLYRDDHLNSDFSLKNHQEEGIAWLQHLYNHKASGCLMADDMGLGKTLQLLYFIDWHSRNNPNHKPYLIVAPVSLLENWENEYNRFFFAPRLKVNRLSSSDVPRQFDKSIIDKLKGMDIIITSYESLRNSQLNYCAVEFDIVVLDEAQKIKTPGTLVTNAAKALKANFKVAMTGTPVENTLLDLWCIMDFCVPGLLDNAKSFAAKYQSPLKKADTDIAQLGNKIHKTMGLYFMRRLKTDAAKDLPKKIELKKKVEMPDAQETAYRGILEDYTNGMFPNMLVTIQNIRTISEHPYIYDSTFADHTVNELIADSARLQATEKFLDEIRDKQEKVIIFAERKDVQKMLQKVCLSRYGIIPKIINGDSPTSARMRKGQKLSRQATIDAFQATSGFNIIIMSPVAAGMGLNVTGANHVIHYSRHWNPAKESQATDRAYRIGQTKDVYVYYPMAVIDGMQTFDETLDDLLSRKTSLASSTIFPTERAEVTQAELGHRLLNA